MDRKFYVYMHRKISDGTVFYVGKGCGDRKYDKFHRSKWWKSVESKHGRSIEICQEDMSESDSFLLEQWLIAKFRHEGLNLVNLSDGGDGQSGWRHTTESIEKIKNSQIKLVYSSTGEKFNGLKDACVFLKSNGYEKADRCPISMCCNGKLSSAYGRAWSYDGFPDHPEIMGRDLQKISASVSRSKEVKNSQGETFSSIKVALEFINSKIDKNVTYFHIKKALSDFSITLCERNWYHPT